ncbi:uncharacterized protein LOC132554770 [Ylistrum balloti]|uniref:uncharacterized protein LOC132554770 n=1 Tax=Ylistrum balloti TaxID=509963 RepID=UPI002905966F|nr:uncharacterized protein LOC132554770 [Ylistrum balloti]
MSGRTNAGRYRTANSVAKWSTVDITCAVLLLMISFTCTETADCRSCNSDNIIEVQKKCLDIIVKLEEAIDVFDNVTGVCKSLIQMYYCVGELVPQCIINFTASYRAFYQSPHDCHITSKEMAKLQQYRLNANCNVSGVLSSLPSHTTADMTSQGVELSTSSTSSRKDTNSAPRTQTGGSALALALIVIATIRTLFVSALT